MTEKSDLWPGDFYRLRETLPAEDQALLAELRAFLEARVARLSGSCSGGRLRLAVEDDGPGIAEHDREEVLLRGRRLDETTAGAGLGLAIARDLAELYRGSLGLRGSGPGGLCATLELPAAVA